MSNIGEAENTEPRPRPCTCHPDDNPPRPCPQKYALTECRMAAMEAEIERLLAALQGIWNEASYSDCPGTYRICEMASEALREKT
jgi:hypothetical protein